MKILVLDDEADIREILAFNLEASGFEVREAGTAEAVLEMLHSGERFDLMLVDVMLPGMSGFKLVLQRAATCRSYSLPPAPARMTC